jgi:hypothetical protein
VDALAICDPAPADERLRTALLIGGLAIAYVTALGFAFWRSTAKARLAGLFVGTLALGAAIAATPNGLSDVGGNYWHRLFVATAAGGTVGAVAAHLPRRTEVGRHVVVGLLGGGGFIPWVVGLFIFTLAVTNSCIG